MDYLCEEEDERLAQGLRAGDEQAAELFFRRYHRSLERLAQKHLAPGMRRRVGPESIAQSVCRTFLRRAKSGDLQVDTGERLWRLLCAIALIKIREKVRFHRRRKRGVDREVHESAGEEGVTPAEQLAASGEADPAEAAAFAESLEGLVASLNGEERKIVELKLAEVSNEEVAQRMGCSDRTVRRLLNRLEERLERFFPQTGADDGSGGKQQP